MCGDACHQGVSCFSPVCLKSRACFCGESNGTNIRHARLRGSCCKEADTQPGGPECQIQGHPHRRGDRAFVYGFEARCCAYARQTGKKQEYLGWEIPQGRGAGGHNAVFLRLWADIAHGAQAVDVVRSRHFFFRARGRRPRCEQDLLSSSKVGLEYFSYCQQYGKSAPHDIKPNRYVRQIPQPWELRWTEPPPYSSLRGCASIAVSFLLANKACRSLSRDR